MKIHELKTDQHVFEEVVAGHTTEAVAASWISVRGGLVEQSVRQYAIVFGLKRKIGD